ncbi:MAG: ABC transporter permease, partial [Acidobacteriota bacterium]
MVRPDLFTLMRAGSATDSGGHARWRGVLVTAQIALAVVLLVGATLMAASLRNLLAVDLGFELDGRQVGAVSLPDARYADAGAKIALIEDFERRISAIPGVRSAALASRLPFSGWSATSSLLIEGRSPALDEVSPQHHRTVVGDGYFEAMGIEIREGRGFSLRDDARSPAVVVISEALAERYWPGDSALGKRLAAGSATPEDAAWVTVVGVAGEVIQEDVTETPAGAYYLPLRQVPRGFMRLVVHRDVEQNAAASPWPQIREVLATLDPELSLFWNTTLRESVSSSLIAFRLPMLFLSIFAGIALVLAAIGVFGVLSRSVSLRSKEIGIRLALGSTRAQVCRFLLRHLVVFVGAGLALGTASALAL